MHGPSILDLSSNYQSLINQVITRGTIVEIMATKCDGIPECFNGTDEKYCGFSAFFTLFMGNICTNSYFLKVLESTSLISLQNTKIAHHSNLTLL